jgi:hypothetical protein
MSGTDEPSSEATHWKRVADNLQRQIDAICMTRAQGFKAETPEHYDGKSAAQLRNFLTQLRLVFGTQPQLYEDDSVKVLYAASLLRGPAFTWIQPYLDMDEPPAWMQEFSLFAAEITATFGDPDLAGTNFRLLKNLKQTSSVASYTAEFRRLANQLTWSEQALVYQYYDGLKDHMQDALIAANYPEDLEQLIRMATRIDNTQYRRRMERTHQAKPSAPPPPRKQPPYATVKREPPSHTPPVKPPHGAVPQHADDDATRPAFRKLTEQEKEHRRKTGKCLYCGLHGHMARDCQSRPKTPYRPARVSQAIFKNEKNQGNAWTQQ